MTNRLSIVIPVFNNWNFTKACLKDLASLPYDVEVIIVDNGSTDQTSAWSKIKSNKDINHNSFSSIDFPTTAGVDIPKNLVVERFDNNFGFAIACNYGYNISKSENVMFLNNDIRVQSNKENWVDLIINKLGSNNIVGPTFGSLDKNFSFIKEESVKPESGYTYLSGWNISANKKVWNKLILENDLGPFSTEFFAYFEDTDLSMRAKELGIELDLVENVPVYHFGRTTGRIINLSEVFLGSKQKFLNKWIGRIEKLYL